MIFVNVTILLVICNWRSNKKGNQFRSFVRFYFTERTERTCRENCSKQKFSFSEFKAATVNKRAKRLAENYRGSVHESSLKDVIVSSGWEIQPYLVRVSNYENNIMSHTPMPHVWLIFAENNEAQQGNIDKIDEFNSSLNFSYATMMELSKTHNTIFRIVKPTKRNVFKNYTYTKSFKRETHDYDVKQFLNGPTNCNMLILSKD